jgi:hypothetical protein
MQRTLHIALSILIFLVRPPRQLKKSWFRSVRISLKIPAGSDVNTASQCAGEKN